MKPNLKSLPGLWPTISTFETGTAPQLEGYPGENRQVLTKTAPKVIYAQFEPCVVPPEGSVDIDDLIAEFSSDSELALDMEEGRKWVAATFYEGDAGLAALRLRAGMSQKELATAVGTSQSAIARIETGKTQPQFNTLIKLAAALGVKTYELAAALAGEKIE